jgi:hypothetical protein
MFNADAHVPAQPFPISQADPKLPHVPTELRYWKRVNSKKTRDPLSIKYDDWGRWSWGNASEFVKLLLGYCCQFRPILPRSNS